VGQHERAPAPPGSRGFWGTLRFILGQPRMFTLGLLAILTASAVLAVHLDNAYGELWGGLVGIFVAPLICTWLLRVRVNKRDRQ
jgi:hypothetical protein